MVEAVACPVCKGKGIIYEKTPEGITIDGGDTYVCSRCGGTGVVTHKEQLPVLTDKQMKKAVKIGMVQLKPLRDHWQVAEAQRDADQLIYDKKVADLERLVRAWEEKHKNTTDRAADAVEALEAEKAQKQMCIDDLKRQLKEIEREQFSLIAEIAALREHLDKVALLNLIVS